MPTTPYFFFFFWLKVHVISLNLIAFIISIETEASLLALAKSIYYTELNHWVGFTGSVTEGFDELPHLTKKVNYQRR